MAMFKFAARLYEDIEDIHAQFRAHQSTILQLATRYHVGQETMRQFLIITLGEEYGEIVRELRDQLRLQNRQSVLASRLSGQRAEMSGGTLTRRMADFSLEELKEIQRRLEARQVQPQESYHPYVVSPLVGDV